LSSLVRVITENGRGHQEFVGHVETFAVTE
jgi:hypothetical protein